jgi:hypothetical protein
MDNPMDAASTSLVAGDKVLHYTVSAEPQETTQHKLTGREILENAGFTPASDYKLIRDNGDREVGLDEEVPIREGEAFTAMFHGPTPTS